MPAGYFKSQWEVSGDVPSLDFSSTSDQYFKLRNLKVSVRQCLVQVAVRLSTCHVFYCKCERQVRVGMSGSQC